MLKRYISILLGVLLVSLAVLFTLESNSIKDTDIVAPIAAKQVNKTNSLGGYDQGMVLACDIDNNTQIFVEKIGQVICCYNIETGEKLKECPQFTIGDCVKIDSTIYTEELCYHGIFHWYDNTTPSNGACGLVSANYGLNPNETTWINFENSCDIFDPFAGHTNTAANLNGYFDDMNAYLTANTNSEWVWGLNAPDKCFRYFSTISKDECYGVWTLDYKGREVTVVPRRDYKKCQITKKTCEFKREGEIVTEDFYYSQDQNGEDSLLLDLPQFIIECTGWDPIVVNKIYQNNGDVISCLTTDCTDKVLAELENPCPVKSYGPFCDFEYNVETDQCQIIESDIYMDIDCNNVEWFYTISESGVEEYEAVAEIGNCDCTQIEIEPAPCPEGLNFECVETGESSYGILDNSLYTGLPTNHLQNGNNYEYTLLHEDGTTTVLQQSANTYFGNFRSILQAELPECKVVFVCANHTSPNGCNANFVNNLAQYPAYDSPTAPADVQNNLSNPAQSELWATGWLIDCESCVSPIVRVTITNANDASHIGAYKDINVYKLPGEQMFRAVDCGKVYYQSCDNPPVPIEAPICKPTICGPTQISSTEDEPDCPQVGSIIPIGSRPITRTFGDIGNGNAGPHVINDFTGPITLEACETGDFQNNGIVSNAFDLGLTGTAPQTCVTVNQTAACAQGTAFVLFQDTPSGGIALPAISSGTGNWQNLGPYAYDSSTGTDVVTTQLCYNTTGVALEDLVFVGFGTGGFGSDTGCCDSYTLISDIAECEVGAQTETQIHLPIDTCYTDACCDGAARITQGRPSNNPMTWEYNGVSGDTFEEFISNLQASGYNTYVTNQNGTGDGTESLEAHWLCPAVEGEEITINGVPIENGLYEFPNPLIALDCESKIDERLKVSLKQQDIEAIANALANKPQTGIYQYCVDGSPVIYCIEGKELTFYQDGVIIDEPVFHDCLCSSGCSQYNSSYSFADNTTDITISNNATDVKWDISTGANTAGAVAHTQKIMDCIDAGGSAFISSVGSDGVTYDFTATSYIGTATVGTTPLFSGTAGPVTGAAKLVSSELTCNCK